MNKWQQISQYPTMTFGYRETGDGFPATLKYKEQRPRAKSKDPWFGCGFNDMHTASYRGIINGQGYGLEEARNAVDIVFTIRNQKPVKTSHGRIRDLNGMTVVFAINIHLGKLTKV